MEDYVVNIEYFFNISFYLIFLFNFHNFLTYIYPFRNHDFKNKTKNIVETFNIIINSRVCYLFFNEIRTYNEENYSKTETITKNTNMGIQLLLSGLIYETIYYYIILERKDKLVFFHHIYTIATLLQYLAYGKLHYYLCMTCLVEFTNIFLSMTYICKRNKLPFVILFINGVFLLISFTCLRMIFVPYIIYEYTKIYGDQYNFSNLLYTNGLFILFTIWSMSVFWYKRLIEIFINDISEHNKIE